MNSVAPQARSLLPPSVVAAKEFSRFSNTTNLVFTGPTTVNVILQNHLPQDSSVASSKKANPWVMMAALALFKLPFSFLGASAVNAWLFNISMGHSIKRELVGIGAEVIGTMGLKLADDSIGQHSSRHHDQQMQVASGIVSFLGTLIATLGCLRDSPAIQKMSRTHRTGRIIASLVAGTLCGVVEGYLSAKVEPALSQWLARYR
ncbi:MAG: hypothetical protein U0003_05170 [Vampirovibrionales bacterium]